MRPKRLPLLAALAATVGASVVLLGASAAQARQGPVVIRQVKTRATNHYLVSAEWASGRPRAPRVTVEASQGRLRASYDAAARFGPGDSVRASLGAVGALELAFHRERRVVERFEPGCVWVFEYGRFRGRFDFAGEEGFTAVHESDLPGRVLRLPDGFCGSFGDDRAQRTGRRHDSLGDEIRKIFSANFLSARVGTENGSVDFAAVEYERLGGGEFAAELEERSPGLIISRRASVKAEKGDFVFGPKHRAHVSPGPPFSGSANLRPVAGGFPDWSGTLAVSLPGASDVPLAGPDFVSRLCLHTSLLGAACKLPGS